MQIQFNFKAESVFIAIEIIVDEKRAENVSILRVILLLPVLI
jgi:hypothetical protein